MAITVELSRDWAVRRNGVLLIRKITRLGALKIAKIYTDSIVSYEPQRIVQDRKMGI